MVLPDFVVGVPSENLVRGRLQVGLFGKVEDLREDLAHALGGPRLEEEALRVDGVPRVEVGPHFHRRRVDSHDGRARERQLGPPDEGHRREVHLHGPPRGELPVARLLDGVHGVHRREHVLEHVDVEEVAVDVVVLGQGILEGHVGLVQLPVDARLVEEMRQVLSHLFGVRLERLALEPRGRGRRRG